MRRAVRKWFGNTRGRHGSRARRPKAAFVALSPLASHSVAMPCSSRREVLAPQIVKAEIDGFYPADSALDIPQLGCVELDRVIRRRCEIGYRPGARVIMNRPPCRGVFEYSA